MTGNEENILQKYRNLELECLGISPQLYANVVKLINRKATVVIANDMIAVHQINSSKHITAKDIAKEIVDVYGITSRLSMTMVNEWLRDSIIFLKMSEDLTNNWEFVTMVRDYTNIMDTYNF